MEEKNKNKPLILITGATGAGKTALSIGIAKKIDAEIISIDSVQVYKGFDIGSAKIKEDEMQGVKHHLLDIWNPEEKFDVAKYVEIAKNKIEEIRNRGKNIVIVGGSMMYVTLLLCGLAKIPAIDVDLRKSLEKKDTKELYAMLKMYDKDVAGKLNPNDKIRIERALEVFISSKKSINDFHKEHQYKESIYDVIGYVICQTREELYKKINLRTEEMIKNGLVDEVKNLLKLYKKDALPFSSIGYKEALLYLENKISIEELKEKISTATRHLAKRQMTYLRNEPIKRGWKVFPTIDDKRGSLLSSDNSTICGKGVIKDFYVYNYTVDDLIFDIEQKLLKQEKGVLLEYIKII